MKSPTTSKAKPALSRSVNPVFGILIGVLVVALVGGYYWWQAKRVERLRDAPMVAAFDKMKTLSTLAKERWAKEQEDAKREGRAPNEAFRPGPNMAPINGMEPMRMGGGAVLSQQRQAPVAPQTAPGR